MTKVKICGITNLDDARHAVDCGADMLGFNLYHQSSRYVEPTAARRIAGELADTSVEKVGVFVNAEVGEIAAIAKRVGLDAVQLHGNEAADMVSRIQEILPEIEVIKAIRVDATFTVDSLSTYRPARILLDGDAGTLFGGAGRAFDWSVVGGLTGIILAGGLTPENVGDAIREVRPYAVDVASGVESAAGKKDRKKVAAFIKAVKEAL